MQVSQMKERSNLQMEKGNAQGVATIYKDNTKLAAKAKDRKIHLSGWHRLLYNDVIHGGLHHCNPTMHTVGSFITIANLYIIYCNTGFCMGGQGVATNEGLEAGIIVRLSQQKTSIHNRDEVSYFDCSTANCSHC